VSNELEQGILLTVRGTYSPPSIEACRVLHNDTAGSAQGIAAARSLGDLSHKVFAPVPGSNSSAKAGEVLFLDWWQDPKGLMDFFSNPHVQEQGGKLFSSRDASVWMPARGAFTYHLPSPASKNDRYVGMVRGQIRSPEETLKIFRAADTKAQRVARTRGILSHELFIKLNAPGDTSPLELLGLDVWYDAKGMAEHYSSPDEMSALSGAFAGRPDATVWSQVPGQWSEW